MTAHVHEELGAYVLGALEPDESDAVREHLEHCPTCAAEHARLARLPDLLDLAVLAGAHDHEPIAPAVEERVLDRFARERSPRRRRRLRLRAMRRWVPLGAAAGALAAAAVVAVLLIGGGGGGPRDEWYSRVVLHGLGPAPAARAHAGLVSVPGGTVVHLWVRNLPADPGAVYEVRCQSPSWSASAGTFRVDRTGRAYVVLTTAARKGQYDTIRVVRRERDSSGHARFANVLIGRLI